jgi:hypothetical protein
MRGMMLMTSGTFTNNLRRMRLRPRLKFSDFLLSLALVGSVWTLIMIFYIVLPSISTEVVHKSDKEILEKVRQVATWGAIGCTFSGVILASVSVALWRRLASFRTEGVKGGSH